MNNNDISNQVNNSIDFDKLIQNEKFLSLLANKAAPLIAGKFHQGLIKEEIQQSIGKAKQQIMENIKSDLNNWYYTHMMSQVERSKQLSESEIDRFISNALKEVELNKLFSEVLRSYVRDNLREKISSLTATISIGDILDGDVY